MDARENNVIRLIKLVLGYIAVAPFHNSGIPIHACGQNVVDVPTLFTDAGLRVTVFFLSRGLALARDATDRHSALTYGSQEPRAGEFFAWLARRIMEQPHSWSARPIDT
jgi:hypothetical protein